MGALGAIHLCLSTDFDFASFLAQFYGVAYDLVALHTTKVRIGLYAEMLQGVYP
jgi:hypothetical protein